MRAFYLALVALVGLCALAAFAILPGTMDVPARACVPDGPLRLGFGEPSGLLVPVFVENVGTIPERVLVDAWEVDRYRVEWTGRLVTQGSQRTDVDHVAGYTGEDVPPGGTLALGDVQLPAAGSYRLVGLAQGACGDARVRA
jgi:hypothetical protein